MIRDKETMNDIWPPARKYFRQEKDADDFKASQRLAKLLGESYPERDYFRKLDLTDDQVETIKRIPEIFKSPHKDTLLKAIEARNANQGRDTRRNTEIKSA
jgi:hypothetical protein